MLIDQYQFLFVITASLPGIYLATKKKFFCVPNPKYNLFILRLLFTVPTFLFINSFISAICAEIVYRIFPELSDAFIQIFGPYAASLIPLFFSLFFIVLLKKFVISEDELKPIDIYKNSEGCELFAFSPSENMPCGDGTKYELLNPKRDKNELPVYFQITDVISDFRYLDGKYLMMTRREEIVVSNAALEILKENNLSGYTIRPAKRDRSMILFSKPDPADDLKYKQLVCSRIMPQMSPKTVIISQKNPLKVFYLWPIYYHQSVLSEIADFNQTFEYFGTSFAANKCWILSKKARDVMIEELDQCKEDFIPV